MDKIIEALRSAGIADEDMVTSNYYMYPLRDYGGDIPVITGYMVSNRLKVTVKDLDTVAMIIDTAVQAGANEVGGISYTLSDEKQEGLREQALENAVKAARSDADALAESLGVTIVGPLKVITGGGSYITPYAEDELAMVEKGATTPILPGDVSITAYVQVIYQFT